MIKIVTYSFLVSFFAILLSGCGEGRGSFLKEHISDYNIQETAKRFSEALAPKRYLVTGKIDHEAIAAKEKMYLQPTLTLELSNPVISSKLISCNQTMSLELPLRISIYNELNGTTHLAYTNPEYWSLKHNIRDKNCIQLVILMARDLDAATEAIKKRVSKSSH